MISLLFSESGAPVIYRINRNWGIPLKQGMLYNSFIEDAFPIFDDTYLLFISLLFLGSAAPVIYKKSRNWGISSKQGML